MSEKASMFLKERAARTDSAEVYSSEQWKKGFRASEQNPFILFMTLRISR